MVLLREIKRRKVLRTLSLYIVGCWVALQVVEVLSEAGLPPLTMRYLLAAMSAGFPIVLIIAWFFDVSTEGITRTRPRTDDAELPTLNLGDHALLVGILAVLALNTYVLSSPAPVAGINPQHDNGLTLAVLPFASAGQADESIGDALAEELRAEFSRRSGIKVMGPETSRAIRVAGDDRNSLASELGVTSILTGDAFLEDGTIRLRARVQSAADGDIVWTSDYSVPTTDGPQLLSRVVNAVLGTLLPGAQAATGNVERISEECRGVYDTYLLARQVVLRNRDRGRELLGQVTELAPGCGVAWESLALAWVDWTEEGFAKAGAAAQRALEIDENLPGPWAVLAEIAEEEGRWNDAEWLYLKALQIDPSNGEVNAMYAETLLARGRVTDSLRFALEAYRYEPVSKRVNFQATLSARYAGDADLLLKHTNIWIELTVSDAARLAYVDDIATVHILRGEIEEAASLYEEHLGVVAAWYLQCIRSLDNPALRAGLAPQLRETARSYLAGEMDGLRAYVQGWHVIQCGIWIDEADLVVDFITAQDDLPTEQKYFLFFLPESRQLRQTEHFRNLVVDSGLLDYWSEWGFADACRPDGDSFACD
jgi:TolB-like protein